VLGRELLFEDGEEPMKQIKAAQVARFRDLTIFLPQARKAVEKMEAEFKELEKRLTRAVEAGARVEGVCPFKLTTEMKPMPYIPAYKKCAVDLAGEVEVAKWVEKHDPHKVVLKLKLSPKKETKVPDPSKIVKSAVENLTKVVQST